MKYLVDSVYTHQAVTVGQDTRNSFSTGEDYFVEWDSEKGRFLVINKRSGMHRFFSETNACFWSLVKDDFNTFTEYLRAPKKLCAENSSGTESDKKPMEAKSKA